MKSFLERITELERQKKSFAVVSVIEASRHSPGRRNFKMCVLPDGEYFGSVGGGTLELRSQERAREMLRAGDTTDTLELVLKSEAQNGIGMECGGTAKVLIECYYPQPTLYIAGGGHIGFSLTEFASRVGFRAVVIDNREEYASAQRHPDASETRFCESYERAYREGEFEKNAFFVIVTHRHSGDEVVLRALLERYGELEPIYVGLIGSPKKLGKIFRQLESEGYDKDALDAICAPIGIDHGGQTAQEIALSIACEMVAHRYGKKPRDAMSVVRSFRNFTEDREF